MTNEKSTKKASDKNKVDAKPAGEKATGDTKGTKQSAQSKSTKKTPSKKKTLTQKEIDHLIVEHADMKAKMKEYQDNFLLLAAEFENYKKRIDKDQLRSKEIYKETMLGNLLPVLDDVERAMQHHEDDETGKAFDMIRKKLLNYLKTYDVHPFDAVGEEFDPEKHDAMLTRSVEGEKDNIVLEEYEKGYLIGKKVLRHAKVIVNVIE